MQAPQRICLWVWLRRLPRTTVLSFLVPFRPPVGAPYCPWGKHVWARGRMLGVLLAGPVGPFAQLAQREGPGMQHLSPGGGGDAGQ